jgi:hypothetical protein
LAFGIIVLYQPKFGLTERLRIFNPSLRVTRERQAVKKPLFPIEIFKLSYSTIQIKPFKKVLFLSC